MKLSFGVKFDTLKSLFLFSVTWTFLCIFFLNVYYYYGWNEALEMDPVIVAIKYKNR